jgi:replicative DNA helicase
MEVDSFELSVLRMLKYRTKYDQLVRAVPMAALDQKTQIILGDFGKFFKEFPDVPKIDHALFFPWFKGFAHPALKAESYAVYDKIIASVGTDVSPAIEAGMRVRLVAAAKAQALAMVLTRFQEGDEVDLYMETRRIVEEYEAETERKIKTPWVVTSIEELLEDEKNDVGLHWRLSCLNESMRPLRGGDFIVIAGRPDKGKTTFISSELTFMAPQVQQMYGDERSILWLNNEGPGKRIIQRTYQSALNATVPELVAMGGKPSTKGKKNLLREKYDEAVGGRWDIIKVFDIHDFWSHEVEDLIRKVPPGLIVFDMVDNIKFGGEAGNNGQRTDQLLEAMYQWARIISVKYDVPVIATSQVSADGDGLQWPTLPMLKDSKTGKQGAAEVIITLGASNDPLLGNSRYINTTKNKLHRSGGPKEPRCEVLFDGERGRLNMPENR